MLWGQSCRCGEPGRALSLDPWCTQAFPRLCPCPAPASLWFCRCGILNWPTVPTALPFFGFYHSWKRTQNSVMAALQAGHGRITVKGKAAPLGPLALVFGPLCQRIQLPARFLFGGRVSLPQLGNCELLVEAAGLLRRSGRGLWRLLCAELASVPVLCRAVGCLLSVSKPQKQASRIRSIALDPRSFLHVDFLNRSYFLLD